MKKFCKKYSLWLFCVLAVTSMLAGCQLAHSEVVVTNEEDSLIGVFVTQEHLDLTDFEDYLTAHPEALSENSTITLPDQASQKIYAQLTFTGEYIRDETGQTTPAQKYVFSELHGIPFFIARMKHPFTGETFTTTHSAEGINEALTDLHFGDDDERTHLEGTIYLDNHGGDQIFYANPVYQTADGRVYVTEGPGIGTSSEGAMAGFSKQWDSTVTKTENGVSQTRSITIKINFKSKALVQRLALAQMDEAHQLIQRLDIDVPVLPESLTVDPEAAYLILEEYTPAGPDGSEIHRSILETGSESFSVYRASEFGILMGHPVQLIWPNE